jgi:SAM-dependent methyltransferase
VSLSDEYRRQLVWRDWATALDALPSLEGRTVLDLGCAVGDVAALLVARGARVLGVDGNEELLAAARSKELPNTELVQADLRDLSGLEANLGGRADGLWCSFAAAYFPELFTRLGAWLRHVRPGGWVALTEIDDFFGHEPLGERTKALLDAYAADALAAGRYDFHMGRKLREHAERAGLTVSKELTLEDREFSFTGPAQPEVLDAWSARFERMTLLRAFCGPEYDQVRDDFLACLARPDHRSRARVCCCIAIQ